MVIFEPQSTCRDFLNFHLGYHWNWCFSVFANLQQYFSCIRLVAAITRVFINYMFLSSDHTMMFFTLGASRFYCSEFSKTVTKIMPIFPHFNFAALHWGTCCVLDFAAPQSKQTLPVFVIAYAVKD